MGRHYALRFLRDIPCQGTKQNASRCEFATSTLGGRGGLLFDAAKREDVRFFFVVGFVTDA
jgi:hypothetical protein